MRVYPVCRVGFGPWPRGNTDGMSRAVRAVAAAAASTLGAVVVRDLFQRKHALLRNFPLIGHGRSLIEAVGPELRQYIVAANNEERPFTRDQRRWVYASAKKENNYFGFGTDNDIHGRLPGDQASHLRSGRAAVGADGRARGRVAVRQGDRCRAGPAGGIPAEIRGQHLRDELRVAVRQRHRGRRRGLEQMGEPKRMYVIVVGAGKVGWNIARELLEKDHEVTLIENDRERYQTVEQELEHNIQYGDASELWVLERAGVQRADMVIAVTGDDEGNMLICQVAKEKYLVERIIARVNNPRNREHFELLGIRPWFPQRT